MAKITLEFDNELDLREFLISFDGALEDAPFDITPQDGLHNEGKSKEEMMNDPRWLVPYGGATNFRVKMFRYE